MNRREILFRGKRVDNGEWVYGSYNKIVGRTDIMVKFDTSDKREHEYKLIDLDVHLITEMSLPDMPGWDYKDCLQHHKVDPATVGQFTGLTDKNGAKIWEGDRLRIPADLWIGDVSMGKNKGTFKDDAFVEYYGGSFRINQIGNDSKLYYGVIDMSRNTGADVVEVIGTIHDTHLTKQS